MTQVVIGVDGGTTAVKAVAFDLEGQIVATHHEGVPVQYGPHGEAEQDMEEVWQAVASCLKNVKQAIGDTEILAIGLTGQGDGSWMIDAAGNPVDKAPNWMDGRAGQRVTNWSQNGKAQKLLDVTGTSAFGGLFPVLYEELRENHPKHIKCAATHFNCKDWIRFKLTGQRLTDYTEASRSFLDVRTVSGYSSELAKDLGMEEAVNLLVPIRKSDGEPLPLSATAAELTGIPAGTPVGIGMIDVAVTGMGLGTVKNGESWLILGTTAFVGVLLPSVEHRRSQLSMVLATGRDRQVLEFLAPMTGTPNLEWIRKILHTGETSWEKIEKVASKAGPGSHGLLYLPYASPGGERAPFLDPNASASWSGMSLTSSREDILRSVYEGVAFSLVECIEQLQIDADLVVSGGGFRSDLVCQILADASGKKVLRQDAPEAGARGAAVLALVSAGKFDSVPQAAHALGTEMEVFAPNPANYQIYRQCLTTFTKLRQAVAPVWKDMRNLRAATAKED